MKNKFSHRKGAAVPPQRNTRGTAAVLLLFLVAIVWGSGFIASQMALDAGIAPALLMLIRFSIACAAILLIFGRRLRAALRREHLAGGILVGVFLFLGFYIQIVGLQYTTPSNNAFLTSSNVVMVPFIWWAVSRKRPPAHILLCAALCLAGIGVLSLGSAQGLSFSAGDLLTLLCAFFFACQIVATGKLARDMDTAALVFLQFATAAVLSLGAVLLTGADLSALKSPSGLGAAVYLGLFSTCLCYFLQTASQKLIPASKAAIILSTEALFGALFSVLAGYELLSGNMLLGGGMVLLSLILTEAFPQKSEAPNPPALG